MITEVLLTSVALCKGIGGIAENVADEYILTALREAQDIELRHVLGAALLDRMKALVEAGEMDAPGNEAYRRLTVYAQYFLAYQALAAVVDKTSFKISNFGVVRTGDEHVDAAPAVDVETVRAKYQNKADAYKLDLQGYILSNRADYPELNENDCHRMRAHLKGAYTGGLWLGGPRGKVCR